MKSEYNLGIMCIYCNSNKVRMTDTNKEETFENDIFLLNAYIQNLINEMAVSQYTQCKNNFIQILNKIKKIKQLHDKEIKNEIMKSLEAQKYLNYIKNNEIKELQAEVEFQRDLLSEPCNECKKKIRG